MSRLNSCDRRLASELANMRLLREHSSRVEFRAFPPEFPEMYIVTFKCLGAVSHPGFACEDAMPPGWRKVPLPWLGHEHTIHIYLPAEYPRLPPRVRLSTPVFHPNFSPPEKFAAAYALMQAAGNEENLLHTLQSRPELRDVFDSSVCIDGIVPGTAAAVTPRDDAVRHLLRSCGNDHVQALQPGPRAGTIWRWNGRGMRAASRTCCRSMTASSWTASRRQTFNLTSRSRRRKK